MPPLKFKSMKKGLLLLLLTLLSSFLFAQEKADSAYYKTFFYPNGKKSSEGEMVNGKPDGYWKSYNEEGNLVSEGNRKNFELDSTWFFYNSKGEKILEINYLEGRKNGRRIQYFDKYYIVEQWGADTLTGNIISYFLDDKIKKITPTENGQPHGIEKEFNTDGTVIVVTNYYRGVLIRREQINRIDNFGFKQGNWKFFWENGNLQMEGTYYNDKKHGFFKYYNDEGNFLSVEKWEHNHLIVDAPETKTLETKKMYHPNGQISISATYYKGTPEGIRREYDTDGNIIKGYLFYNGFLRFEGITDFDGLRQGLWKEYYETGELRSLGYYKNSLPVGEWKYFFPDQQIEIIGSYNNKGKKEGTWQWFYPNGEILILENWSDGLLDGHYCEYGETGVELVKGDYLEGAEEGEWEYNNNGTIEKGSYFDGMRTGIWKIWFPNGVVAFEIDFDQDIYSGKYIARWENGKLRIVGKYAAGTPIGVWYKYDEDENMIIATTYKDGKEVQWNNYKIRD